LCVGERLERLIGKHERGDETGHFAERQTARLDQHDADIDDKADADAGKGFGGGAGCGPHSDRDQGLRHKLFDDDLGAIEFMILASISLDHANALEGFRDERGEVARTLKALPGGLAGFLAETPKEESCQRQDAGRNQRELPVHDEDGAEQSDHREEIARLIDHRRGDGPGKPPDIGHEAGDEAARMRRGEPGEIGADNTLEHLRLNALDDPLANRAHGDGAAIGGDGLDAHDYGGCQRNAPDLPGGRIGIVHDIVDHGLEQPGNGTCRRAHDRVQHESKGGKFPERLQIAAEHPPGDGPGVQVPGEFARGLGVGRLLGGVAHGRRKGVVLRRGFAGLFALADHRSSGSRNPGGPYHAVVTQSIQAGECKLLE